MSFAKILSETKNGEKICACAGTISTREGTATDIYNNRNNKEKNLQLVDKVISSGHKTIIEHHYFNIAFENVSVFFEQFLIEFRLGAYTIKSRRYVNFSKAGYNLPKDLSEKNKKIMTEHIEDMFSVYDKLVADGVAVEDARFVLPYAFASNIYASFNTRELIYLISNMIYGRGKHFIEIFNLGMQLKEQLEERYPNIVDKEKHNYKDYKLNLIDYPSANKITFETADTNILQGISDSESIFKKCEQLLGVKTFDIKQAKTDSKIARILEQFNFTIEFKNLTLSTLTHLVRHRIQSIIVPYLQTFPYSYNFVMPPKISENEQLKELYTNAIKRNREVFEKLRKANCTGEQLIYITLSGTTVNVISTINARELAHMFRLRTCMRAQWEIRDLMRDLLKKLCNLNPILFSKMGASCFVDGACPEGKFCCGKMVEMKQLFEKLTNC